MPNRRNQNTKKRAKLSRDSVLNAAIGLADKIGLSTLSMRRLGQELGVEAMSLYNHISNKEDLLDGLVDRIFAEVEQPDENDPWKNALRACAISKHDALARHPWATGLLESRTNPGPANMAHHESMLRCLSQAGFDAFNAVHAYSALDSYVYGFALQQKSLPFEDAEEHNALMAQALETLPRDIYPHSYQMGSQLVQAKYNFAKEFEIGLELILDGIERLPRKK